MKIKLQAREFFAVIQPLLGIASHAKTEDLQSVLFEFRYYSNESGSGINLTASAFNRFEKKVVTAGLDITQNPDTHDLDFLLSADGLKKICGIFDPASEIILNIGEATMEVSCLKPRRTKTTLSLMDFSSYPRHAFSDFFEAEDKTNPVMIPLKELRSGLKAVKSLCSAVDLNVNIYVRSDGEFLKCTATDGVRFGISQIPMETSNHVFQFSIERGCAETLCAKNAFLSNGTEPQHVNFVSGKNNMLAFSNAGVCYCCSNIYEQHEACREFTGKTSDGSEVAFGPFVMLTRDAMKNLTDFITHLRGSAEAFDIDKALCNISLNEVGSLSIEFAESSGQSGSTEVMAELPNGLCLHHSLFQRIQWDNLTKFDAMTPFDYGDGHAVIKFPAEDGHYMLLTTSCAQLYFPVFPIE